MMQIIKRIADNSKKNSYSNRMRINRQQLFLSLVDKINKSNITCLDVGGTAIYWEMVGYDKKNMCITLLNQKKVEVNNKKFVSKIGDARSMPEFATDSFDVVFSNSVIEHVGDYNDQIKMAKEIERVGKSYFIQTPNLYFPIEPHYLFPGFQFLPFKAKAFLIRRFNLGWYKKTKNKKRSHEIANEIKLLSRKKLLNLFPQGKLYEEKIFGLTKSFVIYKGFD